MTVTHLLRMGNLILINLKQPNYLFQLIYHYMSNFK